MITGGMLAWLPFSTGTVFPVAPAKYSFANLASGYKLTISNGIETTELLDAELRVTGGIVGPPQDIRFASKLEPGPDGLLLESASTGPASGPQRTNAYSYTYQAVDGIQLPSEVTVSPATTEPFHFVLTDCKIARIANTQVAPPQSNPH